MAKITVNALRAVDWAVTSNWEIQFIGENVPSAFSTMFPCTAVTYTGYSINSNAFDIGNYNIRFPKSSDMPQLQITFLDNIKNELFLWFEEWMGEIHNYGKGVSAVNDAVKTVQFHKLNYDGSPIKETEKTLLVYPEGSLSFEGTITPDLDSNTISFAVLGHLRR